MKEFYFGTTNEAKINQIRGILNSTGIQVLELPKGFSLDVEEDGATALDNARLKALTYAKALGCPVYSMDNSLYIDGLPDDKQPGLNLRRVPGFTERLNDEQMIDYYSKLIESVGPVASGYWEYGVCIAHPDGRDAEMVIQAKRILYCQPSKIVIPGYPLESIQIDPVTGKYLSEMTNEERDKIWRHSIGEPLIKFLKNVAF